MKSKYILLIVAFVVVTGALVALSLGRMADSNYLFDSLLKGQDSEFPSYSLAIIYKGKLFKEIETDSAEPIRDISVSPDKKYVAFSLTHTEGGCVWRNYPMVVDLRDFHVGSLEDLDLNKNLKEVLGVDPKEIDGEYKVFQLIKDIKWISNDRIEATMVFGQKEGCPLSDFSKVPNIPGEIEKTVYFDVVKEVINTTK
jgi:hypothetical protein